jgi:hypothetical protein
MNSSESKNGVYVLCQDTQATFNLETETSHKSTDPLPYLPHPCRTWSAPNTNAATTHQEPPSLVALLATHTRTATLLCLRVRLLGPPHKRPHNFVLNTFGSLSEPSSTTFHTTSLLELISFLLWHLFHLPPWSLTNHATLTCRSLLFLTSISPFCLLCPPFYPSVPFNS